VCVWAEGPAQVVQLWGSANKGVEILLRQGQPVVAVSVWVCHQLPLHGELQLAGVELSDPSASSMVDPRVPVSLFKKL